MDKRGLRRHTLAETAAPRLRYSRPPVNTSGPSPGTRSWTSRYASGMMTNPLLQVRASPCLLSRPILLQSCCYPPSPPNCRVAGVAKRACAAAVVRIAVYRRQSELESRVWWSQRSESRPLPVTQWRAGSRPWWDVAWGPGRGVGGGGQSWNVLEPARTSEGSRWTRRVDS